jgi:hypothetical protein
MFYERKLQIKQVESLIFFSETELCTEGIIRTVNPYYKNTFFESNQTIRYSDWKLSCFYSASPCGCPANNFKQMTAFSFKTFVHLNFMSIFQSQWNFHDLFCSKTSYHNTRNNGLSFSAAVNLFLSTGLNYGLRSPLMWLCMPVATFV